MKTNKLTHILTTFTLFLFSFLFLDPNEVLAACPSTNNKSLVTTSGGDNCTISATTVIDITTGENSSTSNGLAVAAGSVTINNGGTLKVGSLTLSGGSLSIQSGGVINSGSAVWVTDADADNWAANFTLYYATAAGRRRLGLMSSTGTADCNDSAFSLTNTCYSYSQSTYYAYAQSSYYAYSQASYYAYSQSSYYSYSQSTYYGYGQSYYAACFLPGTLITMADGSFKEIQDVKPGDIVATYDPATNKKSVEVVAQLLTHKDVPGGYLLINNDLKVTPNHYVWSPTKNGWTTIGSLKIGDTLLDASGKVVAIESVEIVDGTNTVYNLALPGPYHAYFANNFLVHNHKVL